VVEKQGFKGALTMPRQLNYEPLTKTLRAYPVKDVEKLRGKQVRHLCWLPALARLDSTHSQTSPPFVSISTRSGCAGWLTAVLSAGLHVAGR
jgi:sucrose-6-phosphate hydrolase SacC (GH32 family)